MIDALNRRLAAVKADMAELERQRRAIEAAANFCSAMTSDKTPAAIVHADDQQIIISVRLDGGAPEEVSKKVEGPNVPATAPAPEPKPQPTDDSTKPVRVTVRRDWTHEDEAALADMLKRGMTAAHIAELTNRTLQSVKAKINAMRAQGRLFKPERKTPSMYEQSRSAGDVPSPIKATGAAPRREAPATHEVEPAQEATVTVDAIAPGGVESDEDAEFWTPARDLALVEGIFAGFKLADTADEVGCSEAEARDRWRALKPGTSLDDRERLLRRLRAEVPT